MAKYKLTKAVRYSHDGWNIIDFPPGEYEDLTDEFIKVYTRDIPVLIELPDENEGPVEEKSESLPPAGEFYETKIIIPETKADPVQKPRKRRARKG